MPSRYAGPPLLLQYKAADLRRRDPAHAAPPSPPAPAAPETLVKGWFKDTLTPETRGRLALGKAGVILTDCDIYSAPKEALAFSEPHIRGRARRAR